MSPAIFRQVLLISCAHALVHLFELSLPSVEQMIGAEFQVGKDVTGWLGTVWRVPFGCGAVAAGWLVDRYGSKRLLLIYLAGCGGAALLASQSQTLLMVFAAMLLMGCFASIYHPAGLALISRSVSVEARGVALGWHGIFGSVGIAAAPFLAGVVFSTGSVDWHGYYLWLTVPAIALFILLQFGIRPQQPNDLVTASANPATDDETASWSRYGILVTAGLLSGLIYASFMHFLPRYLDGSGLATGDVSREGLRNRLAALVLLCGVAGQWLAGRLARPERLNVLLVAILLGNVPCLAWMAVAQGPSRVAATCVLAFVHFMNQPVYNSLVARYVPATRRSLGYGFSNMLGFAGGGIGPAIVGQITSDRAAYGGLAAVALLASGVALSLCRKGHQSSASQHLS